LKKLKEIEVKAYSGIIKNILSYDFFYAIIFIGDNR